MKYRNKNNGKIVEVMREDKLYIWFKIDGIITPLTKQKFYEFYEVIQ